MASSNRDIKAFNVSSNVLMKNVQMIEKIRINTRTMNINYNAYFHAYNGKKLLYINI